MKRLFLVGSVGLWFALVAPVALACTCVPLPQPEQAFSEATLVFSGTVVGFSDADSTDFMMFVNFEVRRVWKGPANGHQEVQTAGYEGVPNTAACGYPFQVGETYLVYAHAYGPDGEIEASTCTRTRLVADASEDLAFLGEGTTVSTESPELPLVSALGNYPNPFARTTTVSFTLEAPTAVTLNVYDLAGRLVKQRDLGVRNAGAYAEPLDLGTQAAGIYWYEIQTGTSATRQPLLLVR